MTLPRQLTQYVTDILLNEIERRGGLTFAEDGRPCVPYESDFMVETILTGPD